MTARISTRNRATMEKSSLFVEVESLYGATSYPLRTSRLEGTVFDARTRTNYGYHRKIPGRFTLL